MAELGGLLSLQARALRNLWARPEFRASLVTIWVASFGGALHAPVTTAYLRKVGATTEEIGEMGAVLNVGTVLLSPVYGWVLDKYGGLIPTLVTCTLCALGCAIRGFAPDVPTLFVGCAITSFGAGNLWTTVMSFLGMSTPREQRSEVVSAFIFQVAALRLAGKGLYAPFDYAMHSLLGIDDDLLRDRVAMSVCTVFCFFGVFLLLCCNPTAKGGSPKDGSASTTIGGNNGSGTTSKAASSARSSSSSSSSNGNDSGSNDSSSNDSSSNARNSRKGGQKTGQATMGSVGPATPRRWPFVALALVHFAQALTLTGIHALWPIVLADVASIGTRGFGILLFGASAASTLAVGAAPALERRFGVGRAATGLLLFPALVLPVAFALLIVAQSGVPSPPPAAEGAAGDSTTAADPGLSPSSLGAAAATPDMLRIAAHAALTIPAIVSLSAAEPLLQSMATLRAPAALQGRSFGGLAMMQSLGHIAGHLAMTRLYAASVAATSVATTGSVAAADGGGGGGGVGGGVGSGGVGSGGRPAWTTAADGYAGAALKSAWLGFGLLPFVVAAIILLFGVLLLRLVAIHDATHGAAIAGQQAAQASPAAQAAATVDVEKQQQHQRQQHQDSSDAESAAALLSLLPKALDHKSA